MFEICLFGSSFFIFFDQLKWLPFIFMLFGVLPDFSTAFAWC